MFSQISYMQRPGNMKRAVRAGASLDERGQAVKHRYTQMVSFRDITCQLFVTDYIEKA